jgi:hypothetical protein
MITILLCRIVIASAFQTPLPPLLSSKSTQRLLAPATVNISENAPREVASLSNWAEQYGVEISDCFELTSEDGLDIFAMTNQNLPADSPIVCIPNDLIMTGTKAWQEYANDPTIQRAEQYLSPSDNVTFYLFLKILKEYELGIQSPW